MKRSTTATTLGLLLGASVLPGCGSDRTFGERLVADGTRRQNLGREAVAAEKDIARGEAMMRRAQSDRDDSETRLREARRLVEGGQATLRRIEAEARE